MIYHLAGSIMMSVSLLIQVYSACHLEECEPISHQKAFHPFVTTEEDLCNPVFKEDPQLIIPSMVIPTFFG